MHQSALQTKVPSLTTFLLGTPRVHHHGPSEFFAAQIKRAPTRCGENVLVLQLDASDMYIKKSSAQIAEAFFDHWLISCGIHKSLLTDYGQHFFIKLFTIV